MDLAQHLGLQGEETQSLPYLTKSREDSHLGLEVVWTLLSLFNRPSPIPSGPMGLSQHLGMQGEETQSFPRLTKSRENNHLGKLQ